MSGFIIQKSPFVVPTDDGKLIEEHFGLATDGNSQISIAHMIAPPKWSEPFQTPKFDEYTYIIRGQKQFIINDETIVLKAGQSIKIKKETKVQQQSAEERPKSVAGDVLIKLSPVQYDQLRIIASVLNNQSVEEYSKKLLQTHISDRLYLVRK